MHIIDTYLYIIILYPQTGKKYQKRVVDFVRYLSPQYEYRKHMDVLLCIYIFFNCFEVTKLNIQVNTKNNNIRITHIIDRVKLLNDGSSTIDYTSRVLGDTIAL